MFANFFVTAFRNFIRRKQYSLLSIAVMAIGLTTAFLTLIYARYEFSYENHIPDSENIYRVENTYHFPGGSVNDLGFVGPPAGSAFADYFPDVLEFTRSSQLQSNLRVGETRFTGVMELVDANFLEFFGQDLLVGNLETALNDPGSVLLSESTARRFFGEDDPMGKIITANDFQDYRVSGVFGDLPENTHQSHEMVALYDSSAYTPFLSNLDLLEQWNFPVFQTYVRMKPGADIAAIESRLEAFTNARYVHPNPARSNMTPSVFVTTRIRSIEDIHLYSTNIDEVQPAGTFTAVMGLVMIAGLILIAVVMNYINLATALSTLRAREISLRKTMGANNRQIRLQFIAEAVLLALLAMAISLLVVELALPYFSQFLNLETDALALFNEPALLGSLVLLSLLLGVLSGLYPAVYLSRIKPVVVLSSNRSSERVTARARSFLVTLQFAVSIGLLIAIVIVFRQTSYVTNMDIGVDTDNIMVVRLPDLEAQNAAPRLLDELRRIPGVEAVGVSSTVPADGAAISAAVEVPWAPTEDALSAWYATADGGFFDAYHLEPVAGRLFSEDFPADRIEALPDDMSGFEANVLINEAALPFLSIASAGEAVGLQFRFGGSNLNDSFIAATIVGVVPDFQFDSAYNPIRPTFFLQRMDQVFTLSIRTTPAAFDGLREQVEEIWMRYLPDITLTQDPMSELIDAQYDQVTRQGNSLLFLSVVAVLISCLGLFGMSSFMVARRTREIGIRKVLGARVSQIMGLLLIQFSRPVVWANIIAWPVAWYLMRDWLDGFSYRIDLSPIPFLLAGLASLTIAWLIVGIQAFRTARSNPVHALRYE
jgi:putative ABC transport system permease protein